AQQRLGVGAAQLLHRLLAGDVVDRPARIQLHEVEVGALAGDRVGRQHVEHGERGHAGADAERDRDDHERGQRDVAPEAAAGEVEVVREHGGSSQAWGLGCAAAWPGWISDGPRSRSLAIPSTMWTLRWARAAISGSWVTIKTTVPCALSSSRSCITS